MESGLKIRKDEMTGKECWKRWSILSVKAVTYWEHRSCIFASVFLILSSLNSRQANFPVVVSFRNSLTVVFSWTSLLSESLDTLMAGEIREEDMEPFWNTLLRVESIGRTPFKIYKTPMKSGFFNFLTLHSPNLFWNLIKFSSAKILKICRIFRLKDMITKLLQKLH